MFTKELTQAGHTKRFSIMEAGGAWEVRVEQDSALVSQVRYDDWHRVERAIDAMTRQVIALQRLGWQETTAAHSTNL